MFSAKCYYLMAHVNYWRKLALGTMIAG